MSALSLPLPYESLPTVGLSREQARATLKDIGGKIGRQTSFVPVDNITVREGFNWRMKPADMDEEDWLYGEGTNQLDIKGLAESLAKTGRPEPLLLDMLPDGTFVITDGFRRWMAIKYLIGTMGVFRYPDDSEVCMVEAFINPKETTELDRMVSIFTTQNNKKLSGMEVAHGLKRIKDIYAFSNEEIGNCIGKSRQWVDNKIALTAQPELIQEAIRSGAVSETVATALNNNVKSETDKVHLVEESINKGTKLKVSDVSKQELKEKKENAQQTTLFGSLDVSQEKQDAEFALNEATGKADQVRYILKGLNKQNREDAERLLDIIIQNIAKAREFIRAAPEKR